MTTDALNFIEMLNDHASCGEMKDADLDRMDKIFEEAPDECRYQGGDLWRVMRIDAHQRDLLLNGQNVVLLERNHASWSIDPVAIMKVQRYRAEAMKPGEYMLRMKHSITASDRAVDVERSFRELLVTEGSSWDRYASQEKEVIIKHDGGRFDITPDMVEQIWAHDDYGVGRPMVGEMFAGPGSFDDDPLRVDEVVEAYNGGWIVSSGEKRYEIHWDFGELSGIECENNPETPEP